MVGIYGIVNINNGRLYVGSSIFIEKRLYAHFAFLQTKKHPNPYLQSAYNQDCNCWRSFLIEESSKEDLLVKEQYWINQYLDYDLYNINLDVSRPPSFKGRKRGSFTLEHRAKLSLAKIGYKPSNLRPVRAYCSNIFLDFISGREAAKQLNLSPGNICSVLKGQYSQTGGWYFIYLD